MASLLFYFVSNPGEVHVRINNSEKTVNNATTAKIPVALTDDSIINELRFLTLDIENANGLVGGANSQVLINVLDNDAVWNGTILIDDLD